MMRPPGGVSKKKKKGCTADNPFLVDENGKFVAALGEAALLLFCATFSEFPDATSAVPSPSKKPASGTALSIYGGAPAFPSPSKQSPTSKPSPEGHVWRTIGGQQTLVSRGIIGGPPSLIKQNEPRRATRPMAQAARVAASAAPYQRARGEGSSAQASSSRRRRRSPALVDRTRVVTGPHTPIRIRYKKTSGSKPGFRTPRDTDLTDAELYLTAVRPATDVDPKDSTVKPLAHHACAICLGPKSHPVTNPCGHSHCYICMRKALQLSWECPSCRGLVTSAPIPNFDIKAVIAFDHPHWVDNSRVSLSWEGLEWPSHWRSHNDDIFCVHFDFILHDECLSQKRN
ncbi:hypothetical protein C8F04DRAFT_1179495 [Mycena alexandri]|uniref:RING-type domain-containing protein n=1 Tax=Mycena alexandri TaxID=1745969 RepID=A0AAD6X6V9_9AGAR|nr:hypothetical protein C8F04DRAFT_1179495 [Mycena alexandri]